MLDVLGTIAISSTVAVLLVTILSYVTADRTTRLLLAALAGAWLGVAIELAATRAIANLAVLLAGFATPLIIAAVAATSPKVRSAIASIPAPTIIALNAFRVLGVFFIFLALAGRLGGPFPYFAGIGDIVTGLFALPMARLALTRQLSTPRILAWNAFGFLDLVNAVTLGVTSSNGSAIQLIHAGAGSAAIGTLPWSLIPLFLVPLYLIGHAIIFARARSHAEHPTLASSPA